MSPSHQRRDLSTRIQTRVSFVSVRLQLPHRRPQIVTESPHSSFPLEQEWVWLRLRQTLGVLPVVVLFAGGLAGLPFAGLFAPCSDPEKERWRSLGMSHSSIDIDRWRRNGFTAMLRMGTEETASTEKTITNMHCFLYCFYNQAQHTNICTVSPNQNDRGARVQQQLKTAFVSVLASLRWGQKNEMAFKIVFHRGLCRSNCAKYNYKNCKGSRAKHAASASLKIREKNISLSWRSTTKSETLFFKKQCWRVDAHHTDIFFHQKCASFPVDTRLVSIASWFTNSKTDGEEDARNPGCSVTCDGAAVAAADTWCGEWGGGWRRRHGADGRTLVALLEGQWLGALPHDQLGQICFFHRHGPHHGETRAPHVAHPNRGDWNEAHFNYRHWRQRDVRRKMIWLCNCSNYHNCAHTLSHSFSLICCHSPVSLPLVWSPGTSSMCARQATHLSLWLPRTKLILSNLLQKPRQTLFPIGNFTSRRNIAPTATTCPRGDLLRPRPWRKYWKLSTNFFLCKTQSTTSLKKTQPPQLT